MNVEYEEVLHAIELIRELLKHVEKMTEKQRQFIGQMGDKVERFGDGIHLTQPQFAWIRSLAKKHLSVPV